MLLFPTHSECQTQAFLGFGHGLFVHSPGCDRVLLWTSRGGGGGGGAGEGQIGKAVAFGPDRVLFISPNFVFTI